MADSSDQQQVGTRERKRQALRRKLSDTATAMFLADGFDAVRVSDVAKACGVSTKTVWNHFPTKESLILDRGQRLASDLDEAATGNPHADGALHVLDVVASSIRSEVTLLDDEPLAGPSESPVIRSVRDFALLVGANPGLRAATAERQDALTDSAMRALAHQTGLPVESPQLHILAGALISLWRLHLSTLMRLSTERLSNREVRDQVLRDFETGENLVRRLFHAAAGTGETAPRPTPTA